MKNNETNNEIIVSTLNKILDRNKINIVLYHARCFDGFACAFIVWYYYKQHFGIEAANNIIYIPCQHQGESSDGLVKKLPDEFMKKLVGKNILMCDFSYNSDQLSKIISVSNSFMILDHHKTAEAELKMYPIIKKISTCVNQVVELHGNIFFNQIILTTMNTLKCHYSCNTFKIEIFGLT